MIKGSCHCGAVTFELAETPEWLTDCNCSLCRRIGALWAHVDPAQVTVTLGEDATFVYIQGDKRVALHTCKTCGCTTHWDALGDALGDASGDASGKGLKEEAPARMGINCRMAEPGDIAALRVRHFDGADAWEYLD